MELEKMTLEQLKHIKEKAEKLIEMKQNIKDDEYIFEFDEECDKRKAIPYVARIYLNDKGLIEREFKQGLGKQYTGDYVTVAGHYKAKEGEIIEIQTGGSWRGNKYREYYVVYKGELIEIARSLEYMKDEAKNYLKGKETLEDFVKRLKKE